MNTIHPSSDYQNGWEAAERNDDTIPDNCFDRQAWMDGYNAFRRHEAKVRIKERELDQMMAMAIA